MLIGKITHPHKFNAFLDMDLLPKRAQKTIHIDLSQSPHFTPTNFPKQFKKSVKEPSADSPHSQKIVSQRKYKTESVEEASMTSKTVSKEAIEKITPQEVDLSLAKPTKNTLMRILQRGNLWINSRGREQREESPDIMSIPFRSNTTSPIKLKSPVRSPELKQMREVKEEQQKGRVLEKKSSSPVSKFKLAFTERVNPIKNDEVYQRYKVKQSRLTRVIEHRYITEKKEVKKLYQKNGPSEKMKRFGKQRGSEIELLSRKDRQFDLLKDFKHAVLETNIHPEASIMWRRASNPLASRKIMESLRKTNPNRLSITFKQKIQEFAEGTIGEEWFKDRYEQKTERKDEEKEEKANEYSEVLISEGQAPQNATTSSIDLSNTSRPKTMSTSKPRTNEMRSIISSSSRSGRQVVHSKAIGTTAENLRKKYLEKQNEREDD